jgi:hypothetical protein
MEVAAPLYSAHAHSQSLYHSQASAPALAPLQVGRISDRVLAIFLISKDTLIGTWEWTIASIIFLAFSLGVTIQDHKHEYPLPKVDTTIYFSTF